MPKILKNKKTSSSEDVFLCNYFLTFVLDFTGSFLPEL